MIVDSVLIMPLLKQCPACSFMVPISKSVCKCGNLFKKIKPVYNTNNSKRIAMQQKRALESAEEVMLRQAKDSSRRAQKRTLETSDETLYRQEQDQAYTAKKRASETRVETVQRQEQNRAHMAKKKSI